MCVQCKAECRSIAAWFDKSISFESKINSQFFALLETLDCNKGIHLTISQQRIIREYSILYPKTKLTYLICNDCLRACKMHDSLNLELSQLSL